MHACKTIGVEPHETVFLDDIGMNLRAAKKLGMKTIRKQRSHWATSMIQFSYVYVS